MIAAGATPDLIVNIADIYAWTVDFFGLHEGDRFRAKVVGNEPTQYHIWNAKGYMPRPEDKNPQPAKTDTAKTDTLHR